MLIACNECKKEISHTAGACPNCGCKKPFFGVEVQNKEIKEWSNSDKKAFTKSGGEIKLNFKPLKRLISLVGVLFVALIFYGQYLNSNLTPEERAARDKEKATNQAKKKKEEIADKAREYDKKCRDGGTAVFMSQEFVKKRLKSPSTADFPNPYSKDVNLKTEYAGDCAHRVWGYVDSQNGFGAMIRTTYSVEIKMNEDESWSLLDITM